MELKKHVKNDKFKWILTAIGFALIAVLIFSLFSAFNSTQTTTKLTTTSYHIGSLDTTTGNIIESKKNIYSNIEQTKDLDIDLKDNATITYKVAFYDEDEKFISITTSQSTDFDNTNIPSTAEYFRVLITPFQIDGEDVEVTIWNLNKYSSMITVEYAK